LTLDLCGVGGDASAKLRDAAKVIGWGLLLYAAIELVGSKLSVKSVGALAVQMVVAEWGAGRLGVAWSDPAADIPTAGVIARRAGRGALLGIGAAVLVVLFALGTHGLSAHANAAAPSALAIGLVTALLAAARDELLLRGVPLRALRHVCPPVLLLLVCGGAGAAAEVGVLSSAGNVVLGVEVLVAGLLGVIFAALWIIDRGGWLAVGAHAAWSFGTGAVIRGGIFDLRALPGVWGGADAGLTGGLALAVALVPLATLAVARGRTGASPTTLGSRRA
jgi:hypothetical protein